MTTWKDSGNYGLLCREITDEAGGRVIAKVWTRQFSLDSGSVEPYPQGEANFDLVLQAPQTADALRVIAKGAIVSPEQPPEQIAEQVLRVLRLVREENLEYLKVISAQQRRAERAEAALEAIAALDPAYWCQTEPGNAVCDQCKAIARTAIAAVKGEGNETELV